MSNLIKHNLVNKISFVLFALVLCLSSACATKQPVVSLISESLNCSEQLKSAEDLPFEKKLNSVSILYERKCFKEIIRLGSQIRDQNRDKAYSISKELIESVAYEGTATDYVLDSHERIFLSILISLSYLNLNKPDDAIIELNRTYEESVAQIYSSGTDEVSVFLQGLLWLRLEGMEKANPFFNKILETPTYSESLRRFVRTIQPKIQKLQIYSVNKMPEVRFDWVGSYSKLYYPKLSIKNCVSSTGVLINTASWVKNIERRDSPDRDPVLNYKRALRLPTAALSSGLILLAGGALVIGTAKPGIDGRLPASIALITIYLSHRALANGLAPDMRNWYELPEAFYVTTGDSAYKNDPCFRNYPEAQYQTRTLISY